MDARQDHIIQTISNVEGLTNQFAGLTGERIDQVNEALDHSIRTLYQIEVLRVSRAEAALMGPIALIYQNTVFHTLKAYWHASPSLILVLTAIWDAIQIIWKVVKFILAIVEVIQMLNLDDILANYWPAFEEARTKFRHWVSELSEAIGWGVDGFLHLLHAAQGFTDVLGGLMGKSYAWMDTQFMVKTGDLLQKVSMYSDKIVENPGEMLEILFQGELRKSYSMAFNFGSQQDWDFNQLFNRTKDAITGLRDVANEITAIQENMPELIRRNIPSVIWSSLEQFTETIDAQILPRLTKLQNTVTMVNMVLMINTQKISGLADKLAHPGTNLLTIDDLPDYAQQSELWAVDDVSGRLWNTSTDGDRADMQADLDSFAIIDSASRSPLPALEFMSIVEPGRAALLGIVASPQETLFIGGYNSQF